MLLNATGATPSADAIKKVLSAVGIDVEDDKVESLMSAVDGKSIEELIAEGNEKLAAVPAAAPVAGGAGAGAAAGGAGEEAAAAAAEEPEEESDEDMGFGLFD